jgi:hypothetical protein
MNSKEEFKEPGVRIQEDRGRARGGAKTRLRKAYVAAKSTARYDTDQGRAKAKRRRVSARISAATPNVVFAPDLSHACGLHRPGYCRSRQLRNAGRWVVHGAAQIRRGK